MSSNATQHWQGSIEQLREASPAELLRLPLFVVTHEALPSSFIGREARSRTTRVGKVVARLFGGQYKWEGELPVNSGVPEHFDGVINRFLQVNTSYALHNWDPTNVDGGAKFIIRRRSTEPATIHDFFPKNDRQHLDREYENSCRVYTPSSLDPIKPSIEQIAEIEGLAFPITQKHWEVVVPIGATAVFLNGSGHNDVFYTHETASWHVSDRPSNFSRVAKLGRVVGDSIQQYEP